MNEEGCWNSFRAPNAARRERSNGASGARGRLVPRGFPFTAIRQEVEDDCVYVKQGGTGLPQPGSRSRCCFALNILNGLLDFFLSIYLFTVEEANWTIGDQTQKFLELNYLTVDSVWNYCSIPTIYTA